MSGLLLVFALMPLAASAAGNSPQARCLGKVARVERDVRAELARLTPAGFWPTMVSMTYPVPVGGGYYPTGEYMEVSSAVSTVFPVPPQKAILTRELSLLELRRAHCMKLAAADQGDATVSVTRAHGIRNLVRR
jgi:hypothetical protein